MEFVTKDHLNAFGSIMYQYAAAESGIKISLAGLLGIDLHEMLILSEPYSSLNLRNVAKSVVKSRFVSGENRDQFLHLVGTLGSFGPLRNHIGHSRWTRGARPGSIKPFGIDIRSGTAKYLGRQEEECDWTIHELTEEALKLRLLNGNIVQFLHDSGIEARMAANDAASSESTDSGAGNSTSD